MTEVMPFQKTYIVLSYERALKRPLFFCFFFSGNMLQSQ